MSAHAYPETTADWIRVDQDTARVNGTERLSKIDALFLDCENGTVAIQVALAFVLEGPVDFERYLAWLAPRLDRLPRLKHVLKPAPLHLKHAAWVPDTAFDLSNHVYAARVEAPGTQGQLRGSLTELYHRRLSHDRPLWRLYIVDGLEGNRSTFLFCMHHCISDGVGSMEILKVFFESPPEGWAPHIHASREITNHRPKGWMPFRVARTLASREGRARTAMMLRYLRAPAPWFPFIRPVCGRTHYAWWQIPLEELRAVRAALGGTVTDIVVAVMAGGLDRYAEAHAIPVKGQFLRIQLAANVRLKENYGELGNELAIIPVLVPLGIRDPAERLRSVVAYTRAAKDLGMPDFTRGFFDGLLSFLTPPGQALAARLLVSKTFLWLSTRLARSPRDHTLTTSVLMPPTVYRVNGHAVSALLPFIPLATNVGLVNAAITYRDHLQFTLAADVESLPDVDGLMEHMKTAFEELKASCNSQNQSPSNEQAR